jgi:hypothetical protein
LLAALCWSRTAEITDALVDLLIELVHGIGTRAENRVERELISDLRRVRGKQGILFRLAEAALEHPDDTVRAALFPVVGEGTLRNLVREAKANDQALRQRVRTVLRASYSSHYRRMLPRLLAALEFRCANTRYRPVMDALELLARYAQRPGQDRFYPASEAVPWVSYRASGVARSSTTTAGSSGSRTSCAWCVRSETRSVAARCPSSAQPAGATPKTTCPLTSKTTATCTTPRWSNCQELWMRR